MTTTVLERDHLTWKPHAHVDKFTAENERDAMHILFPRRAAVVEKAKKMGHLHRLPGIVVPHITGEQMFALNMEPYGVADEPGNLLLNAGINRMGSLLIAGGGQGYNNANTAIGVGDTATAAAATQTDLSAAVNAANRYFQMADATFPTFAVQVLTVTATFATGNGNFVWNEWMIDQHTASGATASVAAALNRKVVALGTKTSAAAWAFTVTITIS
jgi:hypothetical protein